MARSSLGSLRFAITSATCRLAARFWRSCPTENQHSPAPCAEFCRVAAPGMRGGVLFRGDRGPEQKRETTRTACGETAQPACKRMSVKGHLTTHALRAPGVWCLLSG